MLCGILRFKIQSIFLQSDLKRAGKERKEKKRKEKIGDGDGREKERNEYR
jgi:hypothetical protein